MTSCIDVVVVNDWKGFSLRRKKSKIVKKTLCVSRCRDPRSADTTSKREAEQQL